MPNPDPVVPVGPGTPLTAGRFVSLFWRAARLRCPNCGGHPLFRSWLRMRERCPVCGLLLERGEEGYQVGSYMLNIIASELVPLTVFIVVLVATWPDPPWTLLQYGIAALAIASPFLMYPFTKTFFLAMDLLVRPPTPDELRPVS